MTKNGIDVSYAQGKIDWKKVAESKKVDFVIPREGSYKTDSEFFNNVRGAKENGIAIPGIYHFSYALSVDEAEQEAQMAVKNAKEAGLLDDCVIFFDFEYESEDWCKRNGITPDSEFVKTVTKVFCDEVKRLGYRAGVYTNVDYWERLYKKRVIPEDAVIWAAKWSKIPPDFPYTYWQTGWVEGIPGIKGKVDTDVCEEATEDEKVKIEDDEVPKSDAPAKKTPDEVALEVIRGDWGNGTERKKRLEEAGYDYREIQGLVNQRLYS